MTAMSTKTVAITIPMILRGGTEIQTLALARVLKEEGYRVIVCCYYESESGMAEEFREIGAEVLYLNLKRAKSGASYGQMFVLFLELRKFFRSRKPEIVHVQYVAPGFVPILAARWAGVKTIFATIHYPRHLFGMKEVLLVRFAARLCTMFFCNSLATERSWFRSAALFSSDNRTPHPNHCTVYNAVDVDRIEKYAHTLSRAELKAKNGLGTNAVVGIVARLRAEKGHALLFQAMKTVLSSAPMTRLLVVGDGPDAASLRQLADTLGIAQSIVWTGVRSQEETFALYGSMDIVVVPSLFEGFGLSAAEAMAAGLPVVANDLDGLQEVLQGGVTGILVRPGSIQDLTSSILTLLSDSGTGEQMGRKGKERVRELFSYRRFVETILSAYGQL